MTSEESPQAIAVPIESDQLFLALAGWLDAATGFCSSVRDVMEHTAARQLCDMGESGLQLMLKHDTPSHWECLAAEITGANPVPEEDRGRVLKMREHWREWAISRGLI